MMRRRSAFVAIDSSSLRADFLIRRLYLATSFQVFDDVLEGIFGLSVPDLERLDVIGVLGEGGSDGLVHEVRNTAVGFGSLQTQCVVQRRIEVDRGSFLSSTPPCSEP